MLRLCLYIIHSSNKQKLIICKLQTSSIEFVIDEAVVCSCMVK